MVVVKFCLTLFNKFRFNILLNLGAREFYIRYIR